MGLNRKYLDFIESSVTAALRSDVAGLRMLELGDQVITEQSVGCRTGKEYFTKRGFEHTSVDINGLHGALVRDLTKPEQFVEWRGAWDVVTNSGTTEHVEPIEKQYECFGIIHDCMKAGGVAVHMIPDVNAHDELGLWRGHCPFYYSKEFFETLARECGYEILENTLINGLRCCAVKKASSRPFMAARTKLIAGIARRG